MLKIHPTRLPSTKTRCEKILPSPDPGAAKYHPAPCNICFYRLRYWRITEITIWLVLYLTGMLRYLLTVRHLHNVVTWSLRRVDMCGVQYLEISLWKNSSGQRYTALKFVRHKWHSYVVINGEFPELHTPGATGPPQALCVHFCWRRVEEGGRLQCNDGLQRKCSEWNADVKGKNYSQARENKARKCGGECTLRFGIGWWMSLWKQL